VSPTEEPIRNGIVLIKDGRIDKVGESPARGLVRTNRVIDCSGMTITAGFWNNHVHFFERKWMDAGKIPAGELTRQLQEMLTRYGFTGAFDLSSDWETTKALRNRVDSGEVAGPRIRSTGPGLISVNPGLPPDLAYRIYGSVRVPLPEVGDAAQAIAAVKKNLEAGVDAIKMFVSGPSKTTIPQSAMAAAVKEAHAAGKSVFVHPNTNEDVMAAVRAGVDVIGHTTPLASLWDDAMIKAMKDARVAVIPTFTVWKFNSRHDRVSLWDQWKSTSVGQLRAWVAAGGAVLFGTDGGYADYDPSDEYALMAESGMSFLQILASLTTEPAARFGESKNLGRVAVGMAADLAVFAGDPAKDLRALTNVRYTMRDGKIVYRAN
jgi:imidazolonepropionase-like amidohydrolase